MRTITRPRLAIIALASATTLALAACSGGDSEPAADSSSDSTVEVTDMAGNTVELPSDPSSVAVTDNHAFQILDDWGVELSAAPLDLMSEDVVSYPGNSDIANLGNHREPDLEALVNADPDVVINGYRYSSHAEDIKNLLPEDTAFINLDQPEDMPLDEYLRESTNLLGEIFGHEEDAEKLVGDFDASLDRARESYNGEDTVMGIITSGGDINYAAPGEGRAIGPVFDWLDLTPALEQEGSENHQGDDVSVEAIAGSNPDWLLVMDRDAAVSDDDSEYSAAEDLIKNSEALASVPAVEKNQIDYMPKDFYVHEDIILYTEFLDSMADSFEQAE
ncbi:siderophore ABC transporter substrate-binding protein [Rothia halotolerans]|uniref:siderophore ABC transporter substrate-binding protein n=1 Tax=Rothia halotolerans TaxID=405770 RepID=UPI00101B959D|nr:ABC transporter substrate-binding protein [Rothia halotolerans]